VDWECGGRDKVTCERLIERLKYWQTRVYCTDDYAVYDAAGRATLLGQERDSRDRAGQRPAATLVGAVSTALYRGLENQAHGRRQSRPLRQLRWQQQHRPPHIYVGLKLSNVELDSDEEFKKLDFQAIYHGDYVTDQNRDYIHDRRMAEIIVSGGLPLEGNLQAIIFRSNSDLETFRYYLQRQGVTCSHRVSVENVSGSLFMHMGLYISELNYMGDTLSAKFHFPSKHRPPGNQYKISIRQQVQGKPDRVFDQAIELKAPTLRVKGIYPEASAIWVIYLEGVLAFEGPLAHLKSEVFG
jgi:hypothetical protein